MPNIRDYLDLEATYAKVATVTALAIIVWLYPKYFKAPWQWEVAGGFCATSMTLTAAKAIDRIEQRQRYQRAEKAAQQDLFTTELAYTVWQEQLRQEQAIKALRAVAHQEEKTEPPVNQGGQPASMASQRQAIQGVIAPINPEPKVLDLSELGNYPSVIIYGPQSSGKTSLTRLIIEQRLQAGHSCEALDPHGSKWPCPAVGAGMDYEAIATRLLEITKIIQQRYQYCRENEIDPNDVEFPPFTLVCDEFTNWGPRMSKGLVTDFVRECWSDIRKVDILAIFLAHTNTIEGGLAGANGLANLRDRGCIQLELFPQPHPQTGRAMPAGKGKMKLPAQPPIEVVIPQLMHNLTVQNPVQPTNRPSHYAEPPEPLMNQGYSPIPSMVQAPVQVHKSLVQSPFSYLNPNLQAQLAAAIATNQPKVKSIQNLLGISKGGSSAWQQASSDWDELKAMMG